MRSQFLAGAHVVLEALRQPGIAEAWDQPSVLEGQTVGALCGHLARGSVWVVADYLELDEPDSVTFETADQYGALASSLTEEDHVNIRKRAAEVASMGYDALVAKVAERLTALEQRLADEPPDRIVPVFGGMTMRLDPYLSTRMLEQVVHLDDLARSVDFPLPEMPRENVAIVLDVGSRIGLHRFGAATMIRGMFRGLPGAFPVL
ncbi:MAG: maleylpyruvate isomerase N-terminal domain-containing protein [Acidimicrobiales bacterium]